MFFIWDWIWGKLNGIGKITTQLKVVGRPKVDNQVREEIVRNGRKVPTKTSNRSPKPTGVRSNNKGKTGRKSTGAAIRAAAAKGKAKSKALSKG